MDNVTEITEKQKTEGIEVPTITDPRQYLTLFYESAEYKKAYDVFFAGKDIPSSVTEERKQNAFMNQAAAEAALSNFHDHQLRLGYDPTQYTPEISGAWSSYVKTITKMKIGERLHRIDRDEKMALDEIRSIQHHNTASLLEQEGIVPNTRIGKKLVQYMSIDAGLEIIGVSPVTSTDRLNYAIGGKQPAA